MDTWPLKYPDECNCQGTTTELSLLTDKHFILGKSHKFYKNCLGCGLIFCQQNSKLSNCTFCSLSFDSSPSLLPTYHSSSALEKALSLQNRLLAADNDSAVKADIKDEYSDTASGSFLQTNFCPASEIVARKVEIDAYKAKLAQQQEERSTRDLSEMLNFQ